MAEAVHELPHTVKGGKVQARDDVAALRRAGTHSRLEEVAAGWKRHHLQLLLALLFMAK